MNCHRYQTRSKTSGNALDVDAVAQDKRQLPLTSATEDAPVEPDREDSTQAPQDIPTLFTLPAEIQKEILEYVVLESDPINLRVYPFKRIGKKSHYRIDLRIQGQRVTRPAVLQVCKHLRGLAGSIYFSGNAFTMAGSPKCNEMDTLKILQKLWGEEVKHIRDIKYRIEVAIYYHGLSCCTRVRCVLKQDVVLYTSIKLLAGGTLVLSRESSGSRGSDGLPRGEVCHCDVEALGNASKLKGNDNRRVFEMMSHCAQQYHERYWAQTCDRCNRPCLVLESRPVRTVFGLDDEDSD